MASPPVNQHCANCIDALSFPVVHFRPCARWFDGECNCSGAAERMIMTCNRETHYRRLQSPDALMMKLRCIHRGRPVARGGATVLKVGGGRFCERSEQKIFFDPPTFWPVGGGQNIAYIDRSA